MLSLPELFFMRERLRLLGLFAIYFLLLQVIIRIVFVLYNHEPASSLQAHELLKIFLYGFKMDMSMSGYYLMATGLILTGSVFSTGRWLVVALNTLTVVIVLLTVSIVIVDIELYRHWGFRLNTTPFLYMGSEAMGSVDIKVILNLLIILVLLLLGTLFTYRKLIEPHIYNLSAPATRKSFLVMLIISALFFIPIRGSFTVAPMNTGFVYFHKTNAFANHAAINVVWNFLYSLRKGPNIKYNENFYDREVSEKIFKSLYTTLDDSTTIVINQQKPNVIFFILESFTADVIEPLGGVAGAAPNISALCKEGVVFNNMYSSGDRTDKGIVSILSGYPSQPATSIIKYPAKSQSLPYLTHEIQDLGYKTSFTYGGDIDFANFRSYLTNCRFDYITTEEDFDDDLNYSKWGVHDHIMLERAFQEVDSAKSPFFKIILTLSSHEPFDVPLKSKFLKGDDEESLFLNSVYYTDSAVGVFINKAKASSWWNNTLIVMVADHGHRNPGKKEAKAKERFRIPFLLAGGAIKKDSVIQTFCNQTDIANTLLGQLGEPKEKFTYSNDLLTPDPPSFAYYFYNDGYGYVAPGKYVVYDNVGKQFLQSVGVTEEERDNTKAYQQILYSDYNKR